MRAAAKRSYHTPTVRGGGPEEQPHVQGAVAAWVQEGQEELLHVQGQERRSCIQKQRHYFANKGPSSQGYGLSCGHVWM